MLKFLIQTVCNSQDKHRGVLHYCTFKDQSLCLAFNAITLLFKNKQVTVGQIAHWIHEYNEDSNNKDEDKSSDKDDDDGISIFEFIYNDLGVDYPGDPKPPKRTNNFRKKSSKDADSSASKDQEKFGEMHD